MPFINTKVTNEITKEKEEILKSRFAKAMALIGKPEAYVMLSFEDNCRIWFAGDNSEDSAFVDVSILHSAPREAYEKLTAELCGIISEELSIKGERIYIKYEETENWGHNGYMF
ncbi:MAG: phenylpyruvate tautomerase MIF-related protein [Ruminococcus sp.]